MKSGLVMITWPQSSDSGCCVAPLEHHRAEHAFIQALSSGEATLFQELQRPHPKIPPDPCSVCLRSTMEAELMGFTLVYVCDFTGSSALCIHCSSGSPDPYAAHRPSCEPMKFCMVNMGTSTAGNPETAAIFHQFGF